MKYCNVDFDRFLWVELEWTRKPDPLRNFLCASRRHRTTFGTSLEWVQWISTGYHADNNRLVTSTTFGSFSGTSLPIATRPVEGHDVSRIPNEFVSLARMRAASQSQTNTSFRFVKSDRSLDAHKLQTFPPGRGLDRSFQIRSLTVQLIDNLRRLPVFDLNNCIWPLHEQSQFTWASWRQLPFFYDLEMVHWENGQIRLRTSTRQTLSFGPPNSSQSIETWWSGWYSHRIARILHHPTFSFWLAENPAWTEII
jgi:hypothetical protein